MTPSDKFDKAIRLFDKANEEDPNREFHEGKEYSKELLYARRMTKRLTSFDPEAEEALQLAVRCQHLQRWKIPREDYEMNRNGYLKWRNDLKKFHAKTASDILASIGYENEIIEKVRCLLLKKQLKRNQLTQTLEDVVCLVFLEFYFEKFSKKYGDEKLIDILQKTWSKMSEKGRKAALELQIPDRTGQLVSKALA